MAHSSKSGANKPNSSYDEWKAMNKKRQTNSLVGAGLLLAQVLAAVALLGKKKK